MKHPNDYLGGKVWTGGADTRALIRRLLAIAEAANRLSAEDVGKVLENQHEHVMARKRDDGMEYRHKAEFLQDRFVKSKHFHLRDIPVNFASPIGSVHKGAKSATKGPIIVDENKSSYGRGMYGAPPRVVVLDGKHRLSEAISRGDKFIKAHVGEEAVKHLPRELR